MDTSTTEYPSGRASYGFGTELNLPFDQAVALTKSALQSEGFGVLTTIDVRQTMREKLDIDFEPYVILGACNPALAHRALTAEPELGLLLPCNVVVHEHDGTTAVSIVDPVQMLGFVGDNPEVSAVAAEAAARLRRVIATLERSPEAPTAAET
jgi:uncharacterized protein (DUF302 family)